MKIKNINQHRIRRRKFKKLIGLHKVLRARYTDKKTFTVGQVETVFSKTKIAPKFLDYAYALYISKADFEAIGSQNVYNDLREEISNIYFKGDSELVGTEGITNDFEKINRYPQQWHNDGLGTLGGS